MLMNQACQHTEHDGLIEKWSHSLSVLSSQHSAGANLTAQQLHCEALRLLQSAM